MLKPARVKRLSDLLPHALGPAAARQGFAGAEIMARWEQIVGPDIAAHAIPVKLKAPPRAPAADPAAPRPASTLTLRVEGAFALEIQHRTPEIMERVNAHLGWICVGGVKLRQGPVAGFRAGRRSRPAPLPPSTPDEAERVTRATAAVTEDELAASLDRLGRAVLAKGRVTPA